MTKHSPFIAASLGLGLAMLVAPSARGQDLPGLEALPQITLRAEPSRVPVGAPSLLSWSVEGAGDLVLIEGPAPLDPPVGERNLMALFESGERVEPTGERFVDVERTKELRIVALSAAGVASASVIVEVEAEPVPAEPMIWNEGSLAQPFAEPAPTPLAASLDTLVGQLPWRAGPPLVCIGGFASAKASTTPQVIFENETATHSWSVSNAQTAERSASYQSWDLVPDTSQVSGTRLGGGSWGAGGVPLWSPAGGSDSGTETVPGKMGLVGARLHGNEVTAYDSLGSEHAAAWVDVLSRPGFTGSYGQPNYPGSSQTRQQAILSATKTVMAKLRNGCIYNDAALDVKVPAFQKKQLNRKDAWTKIVRELYNMRNITVNVGDVTADAQGNWVVGQWKEYTNKIDLNWALNSSSLPNLPYLILHELVHRSGFNGKLMASGNYSQSDIEYMAFKVSDSCFP